MMQQINLYQPMFRREKKVFSAQAMLEVTVAVLLLLLAFYGVSAWNTSRLGDGLASMETSVKSQQDNLVNLRREFPQKIKDKLLAKRIMQLERTVEAKKRILAALSGGGNYGNKSGFSQLLAGFARQHVEGIWLEQLEIDQGGLHLKIQGNATSPNIVPKYIRGLAKEQIFEGRKFAVFQMTRESENGSYVHFSLSSRKEAQ